jgi:cyclopropane-fatty-acyl-phospholipid synthase
MMRSLPRATAVDRWAEHVRATLNLPAVLRLSNGDMFALGAPSTPARVEIRARDASALSLLSDASVDALCEAYVKQRIDVSGTLPDFVDVVLRLAKMHEPVHSVAHRLHSSRSLSLDAKHELELLRYRYDLSNDFYRLWLDENLVYAPARFEQPDESLERAQADALDRMLNQLRLHAHHTLLDVNCGWGALVIRAAQRTGARCIGITQSEPQYQLATERIRAAGLSDRIEIRLADYRELSGRYDRIASIGLDAPTGPGALTQRFTKLQTLLADDGMLLTQVITSADRAALPDRAFAGHYVFLSAQLPARSFALRMLRRSGLESLDVESLRGDYAKTLQCWTQRFEQNAAAIRDAIGETKFRIWRVHLAGRAYALTNGYAEIHEIVARKRCAPLHAERATTPDTSQLCSIGGCCSVRTQHT